MKSIFKIIDLFFLIAIFFLFFSGMDYIPTEQKKAFKAPIVKPTDKLDIETRCLENQRNKKIVEVYLFIQSKQK